MEYRLSCLHSKWAKGYSNNNTHRTSLSTLLSCTCTNLLWGKTQCPGFLKFPTFWLSGHNALGVCNPAVYREVKGQKEGIHYPWAATGFGKRGRDLQIGHTCFLLTSASLQYLHNQLMINRPDQRASWLVKQVASRLRQRWRGGKKCLFWSRLNPLRL